MAHGTRFFPGIQINADFLTQTWTFGCQLYFRSRCNINTFLKRFHLNSNTMRAFQDYAKISERSGRKIIETFLALQPRWKFSGKSGPPTEVVVFDVQFCSSKKNNCAIVNRILIQQCSSGLCWSGQMRATHGILPKRVEVANKVINKLAITWSSTESFLGLSLSTWTFSYYAFTTLNFHTDDIVMLTLVGALKIGVNSAITMYE